MEEMVAIMEDLQKYVPHVTTTESVPIPDCFDEQESVQRDFFHQVLFGGDQLIKVRAESAKRMRGNSHDGVEALRGLVPVIEDWHAKQCLAGALFIHYMHINNKSCS